MEFIKALKNVKNKSARRKGTKLYFSGGTVFFSRLYGYDRIGDEYKQRPRYAEAIQLIYTLLIDGLSLPEIKAVLDQHGYRDGSNAKYSLDRIASVVRPIYAGYLVKGMSWKKVDNLDPMVSVKIFKDAKKALDKQLKKMMRV